MEKGGRSRFQVEVLSSLPIVFESAPATANQGQRHLVQKSIEKKRNGAMRESIQKHGKKTGQVSCRQQRGRPTIEKRGISFEKAKKSVNLLCDAYSNL